MLTVLNNVSYKNDSVDWYIITTLHIVGLQQFQKYMCAVYTQGTYIKYINLFHFYPLF